MKLAEQVRRIVKMSEQSEEEKTKKFLEEEYHSFLEEVKKEVYARIVEAAQKQHYTIRFNFHPCHEDFINIKSDYLIFSFNQYTICDQLQRDILKYLEDEGFNIERIDDEPYEIRVCWLEE